MKLLNQRKEYIAHKSKQLDKVTDAHKYTNRLSRVMNYHKLLTDLEVAAVNQIIKGDGIKMKVWGAVLHVDGECQGSYDKARKDIPTLVKVLESEGFTENHLGFYEKINDYGEKVTAAFIELDLEL